MSIRRQEALDYHAQGRPGKIQVSPTKPFKNQRDLSLAYTPGVAEPCREIAARPEEAYTYTAKGNLVAVVTNGTAVLGLGNIGPLAGKPVMEGKGILFKAFADIDVFDLEVGSEDPEDMIRFCRLLEPTVGGINLEDIRSPDCFHIEKTLRDTLSIPVFHDDQHGTAIITGAALLNALELVKKDIASVQVVFAGAGAAAIATAEHYVRLGVPREHITLFDEQGVIHVDRSDLDEYRRRFAVRGSARTLADALKDADVFVGLSVGGIVSGEMLKGMAKRPIVFALANPNPEITPEEARQARSDAIIATGRSDYPNQVNNVLGFPFIFRGALDVRAKKINEEMDGGHAGARRARERRSARFGDARVRARAPPLRSRLPHPQAVRPTRATVGRAGRGMGGGRLGGRGARDRRGRVPRRAGRSAGAGARGNARFVEPRPDGGAAHRFPRRRGSPHPQGRAHPRGRWRGGADPAGRPGCDPPRSGRRGGDARGDHAGEIGRAHV